MRAAIEQGLRERYEAFARAAQRGDLTALRTLARDGAATAPGGASRTSVQQLAAQYVGSAADARRLLEMAAASLPEPMWASLVVSCGDAARAEAVERELAEAGLAQAVAARRNRFLKPLGMLAIPIPPLPGLLDWVGQVPGVELLGDGDRTIEPVRPCGGGPAPAVGPLMAMHRAMLGGEAMPEGLRVERDSVRVAVIDSGIDGAHPALAGRIEEHIDLSPSQLGPVDPVGHGTHVAGIIAGLPLGGAVGLAGVAPFARLLDIQVYDPAGSTTSVLLEGIGRAIELGVDVLNLSLGSRDLPTDGRSLESQAITAAAARGILCCVAAGNDGEAGEGSLSVPGDALGAVTVAAVDLDGRRASFSSRGPTADPASTGVKPTVAAPGVRILAPRAGCCTAEAADPLGLRLAYSGTSMATALVSGVCALVIGHLRTGDESPGAAAIVEALQATADPHGEGPDRVGAGVPRVPALLRHFGQQVAGESRGESGTERFFTSYLDGIAPWAAREPDGPLPEARIVPPAEVAPPPRPAFIERWQAARAQEAALLSGVRAQLERYGADLAADVLGSGPAGSVAVAVQDEARLVRDRALQGRADPETLGALPANGEVRARIARGRKTVLRVFVKSFAAWQCLRGAGYLPLGREGEEAANYLASLPADDVPCLVGLFAPAGWPPSVEQRALAREGRRVLLCRAAPGTDEDLWCDLLGGEFDWHTWLCLTPMSLERRLAWCVEHLDADATLRRDGLLSLDIAIERLGLPAVVGEPLLDAVCSEPDARYRLGRTSGGSRFVERKTR